MLLLRLYEQQPQSDVIACVQIYDLLRLLLGNPYKEVHNISVRLVAHVLAKDSRHVKLSVGTLRVVINERASLMDKLLVRHPLLSIETRPVYVQLGNAAASWLAYRRPRAVNNKVSLGILCVPALGY